MRKFKGNLLSVMKEQSSTVLLWSSFLMVSKEIGWSFSLSPLLLGIWFSWFASQDDFFISTGWILQLLIYPVIFVGLLHYRGSETAINIILQQWYKLLIPLQDEYRLLHYWHTVLFLPIAIKWSFKLKKYPNLSALQPSILTIIFIFILHQGKIKETFFLTLLIGSQIGYWLNRLSPYVRKSDIPFINHSFSFVLLSTQYLTTQWIEIGSYFITKAIFVYPITFLITDFVGERWGKKASQEIVYRGFITMLLAIIFNSLSYLIPSPLSSIPSVLFYRQFFAPIFLFSISSWIAYLIGQELDLFLFHWIKKKTRGKKLWLRNNIATILSQAVDTIAFSCLVHLFSFFCYIPINWNWKTWYFLACIEYPIKIIWALFDTPILYLLIFLDRQNLSYSFPWEILNLLVIIATL